VTELEAARAGAVVVVARQSATGAGDLLTTALDEIDLGRLRTGAPTVTILVTAPAADPSRLTELLAAAGFGAVAVLRPGSGDTRTAELPEGSVLQGIELPSSWLDADFRVVVAGASTDVLQGYHGTCAALANLIPSGCAVPAAEVVADLLKHVPPDLAVVDATVASDGCFGSVRAAPRSTQTVVAGTSAIAVDEVLATLMGVDPAQSPVVAHAMTEMGLPVPREVHGSLQPWEGWRPVPAQLADACRRATAVLPAFGLLLQTVAGDAPAPDDDPVLREIRRWFGPLVQRVDEDPTALSSLVAAVESLAFWGAGAQAWSTVFAKARVPRPEVSLGMDLGSYTAADYDAVADYLAPLAQLAAAVPPRAGGLRWRRYGGGVLFCVERDLDAPYDAFVARVDLSRAIRLMNDYVGGTAVVVARDDNGRVVRQAERNLYLPQPNYLAFSGGECIDVCKLEVVHYGDRESTISWRTVRSPNGTAVHDDGAVTFRAIGDQTRVTIVGLQEFVLPPFWQTVDLARYPALYDALTEDAYRRFFTSTLDNFEGCYEGRDVQTGRAVSVDPEPPTARWSRGLQVAAGLLREVGSKDEDDVAPTVDRDGFRHVAGQATPRVELTTPTARRTRWESVVADLTQAVARDLAP
jgi:hypothetical protein